MHVHFPSQRRRPSAASPSHLGSRRVRHPPTPGCCKHRGIICFGNRSSTYFSLFIQEPLPVTGSPCRGRRWPFQLKISLEAAASSRNCRLSGACRPRSSQCCWNDLNEGSAKNCCCGSSLSNVAICVNVFPTAPRKEM